MNFAFVRNQQGGDVLYLREDHPQDNVWFYGATYNHNGLTSDAIWEIRRLERIPSGELISKYANASSFTNIWDNRASYFPAPSAPVPVPEVNVGSFTPRGLNVSGRVTQVTLNATTWTALPATPLTNRNAMAVQNISTVEIRLNYAADIVGFQGMRLTGGQERQYDIRDTIVIYGKARTGTATINVEEIA